MVGLRPRKYVLEVLAACTEAAWSGPQGEWRWGGIAGVDSISNAEQILCFLLPGTSAPDLRVDMPDLTHADALTALDGFGSAVDIPQLLFRVVLDFLALYTDAAGDPLFGDTNRSTESQAISIRLLLAVEGQVRRLRTIITRAAVLQELDHLAYLVHYRLTAAMEGLVQSFEVWPADSSDDDADGKIERLRLELQREDIGLYDLPLRFDLEDRPIERFACGWTTDVGGSPIATLWALDAIADVLSDRTRRLELLSNDQQALASALSLRSYLVHATLSSAPPGQLARIDNAEGPDRSLLGAAITLRAAALHGNTDDVVHEVAQVLSTVVDQSRWHDAELSTLLLRTVVQLAVHQSDPHQRRPTMDMAEQIYQVVQGLRRTTGRAAGLWGGLGDDTGAGPSWHQTLLVLDALLAARSIEARVSKHSLIVEGRSRGGHVFISYSHHADVEYVEQLARFLTRTGIPVWYDKEIMTGARWETTIREHIDTCAAVIVVMTPEAARSAWVAREIDQAQQRGRPIIPLHLSGDRFTWLANLQSEDVVGGRMPSPRLISYLLVTTTGWASDAAVPDRNHLDQRSS